MLRSDEVGPREGDDPMTLLRPQPEGTGRRSRPLAMIACCIPMMAVVGANVAGGVLGAMILMMYGCRDVIAEPRGSLDVTV